MMRVAVVEGGRVSNVVLYEDGAALPGGCVQLEPGSPAAIGWHLVDGVLVAASDLGAAPKAWSPLEFLARFTPQELGGIAVAAQHDPEVAVWQMMMLAAGEIRSDDPRTADGVRFAVAKGLLTVERAQQVLA